MELKRDSLLVRYAYWLSRDGAPSSTTLCALFWRCLLLQPLKFAALGFAIFVVIKFGFIDAVREDGWWAALILPGIRLTLAAFVAIVFWIGHLIGSPFAQDIIDAIKERYCPIITLK